MPVVSVLTTCARRLLDAHRVAGEGGSAAHLEHVPTCQSRRLLGHLESPRRHGGLWKWSRPGSGRGGESRLTRGRLSIRPWRSAPPDRLEAWPTSSTSSPGPAPATTSSRSAAAATTTSTTAPGAAGRPAPTRWCAGSTCSSSSAPARCGPAASCTRRSSARCSPCGTATPCPRPRSSRTPCGRCASSGAARRTACTASTPSGPASSSTSTASPSATRSGRLSATTSSAACGTSTGCRCWRTSSGRRPSAGPSSRTSAPSPSRARSSSRRRTSATGTPPTASSSWTGRREATARAPASSSAATRMYALEVMHVELSRVDLLEVNLREGKVTAHPWDEASLDRVREHIRLSVRAMKAYLKDPERNLAEEANFEKIGGGADLPVVQLPRGLQAGAAAVRRARGGAGRGMKALLVDLDDTLLDYSGGVDECWSAACETVAGPAGVDTAALDRGRAKGAALVLGRSRASPARARRHAGRLAQDRRARPRADGRAERGPRRRRRRGLRRPPLGRDAPLPGRRRGARAASRRAA